MVIIYSYVKLPKGTELRLSGEIPSNASAAFNGGFQTPMLWLWWWVFRPHISIYINIHIYHTYIHIYILYTYIHIYKYIYISHCMGHHGTSWDIMGHLYKPSNWLDKHPHFWCISHGCFAMVYSPKTISVCLKTYCPGTESKYLRSWLLKSIHLSIYIYI